jgi:DNA-binding transcriptional MocR family regulator
MQATPLYEELATSIRHLIHTGTMKGGERMVSLRDIAQRRKVSMTTAIQAYRLLETQGLIEARPQSGYFVRMPERRLDIRLKEPAAIRPSAQPAPVTVSALVREMLNAPLDPTMLSLGSACPTPDLFPTVAINRILARLVRTRAKDIDRYRLGIGVEELRREIGRRSIEWGLSLAHDQVIVTNGCMEALNIALRAVTRAGDTVAVESPSYFGMLQVLESLGLKALHVPTDPTTGMDVEALEALLKRQKVKAVLLCANVSNPVGATMPDEAKAKLADLAARYRLPVIEDDIYGDLHFSEHRPKALKAFDKEGWVMLCGSFTKTLTPGLRIGFIAPGRFQQEAELAKITLSLSTMALPQLAIAEFMRHGPYDKHMRNLRRTLKENLAQVRETVAQTFPKGTRATNPSGGYVVWVGLPKGVDTMELYRRARAEGISIAPGALFTANDAFKNYLRVAYSFKWTAPLDRALGRVGALACTLAGVGPGA